MNQSVAPAILEKALVLRTLEGRSRNSGGQHHESGEVRGFPDGQNRRAVWLLLDSLKHVWGVDAHRDAIATLADSVADMVDLGEVSAAHLREYRGILEELAGSRDDNVFGDDMHP